MYNTKEEREALEGLTKDKDNKILPADKGKCTVLFVTVDYQKKCLELLCDSKTYEIVKENAPRTHIQQHP